MDNDIYGTVVFLGVGSGNCVLVKEARVRVLNLDSYIVQMEARAEHEVKVSNEGAIFMVCNQNIDVRPIVHPHLAGVKPVAPSHPYRHFPKGPAEEQANDVGVQKLWLEFDSDSQKGQGDHDEDPSGDHAPGSPSTTGSNEKNDPYGLNAPDPPAPEESPVDTGSPANDETNAPNLPSPSESQANSPAPSEPPAEAMPPVNPPFIFRGTPEGNALEEMYGKLGEQPDLVPPESQDVHDEELDEEPEQPVTAPPEQVNQGKYSPIEAGETLRLLDQKTGKLREGKFKVVGTRRSGARRKKEWKTVEPLLDEEGNAVPEHEHVERETSGY